ncbi:unnamed protein product [Amoebophrya sp. A25]|nr:unnamed protein product [Amoebophrya sp. A25]|eukprot:GSA25T00020819001.1
MRLSVALAFAGTAESLRLDHHAKRLARKRMSREANNKVHAADKKSVKLDPTENEHANPFFVRDWWPHPAGPKDDAAKSNPENAETLATEEANAEAMNADGFAINKEYEAEASKKASDNDAFNEELKKKAEEEKGKAKKAEEDAKAVKKKAEETRKAALKALLDNLQTKVSDLQAFKNKELAKCDSDLTGARNKWQGDQQWFHRERQNAANNFRGRVNRAPWWKKIFVYAKSLVQYHRRLRQIEHEMGPKKRSWKGAKDKHRKCMLQRREFDWQIAQAKAKYEEARGTPETDYLGCFADKPQRAMMRVRGWFSIKKCAKACGKRGTENMAMQDGHQCFCGRATQHEKYGKKPDGDCSKPCEYPEEREAGKKCGGAWRNSVYQLK